jgi:nucleoside diphosphate kinase
MKNINQIIKELEKKGFRIEYGNGSLVKIYPLDETQPFYSCHIGERAIHPLKRFAKKKWNLDLKNL